MINILFKFTVEIAYLCNHFGLKFNVSLICIHLELSIVDDDWEDKK